MIDLVGLILFSYMIKTCNYVFCSAFLIQMFFSNQQFNKKNLNLQYPFPIIKKAWELGLMNGHIPQEYGMTSQI